MEISNKAEFNTLFRQQLRDTEALPPLPESARQLLKLRNNPDANLDTLIEVIEQDPSLTAQVLRYGRQAIYGYGDRIQEVQHAVSLVMGFDTALHFCLGLASGKSLQCQNSGPLSRMTIWQQALECATLCQRLSAFCKGENKPSKGLSYLCGLMHNFGYLAFGHMHPKEYAYLNTLLGRHPTVDIRAIELHAFGISHDKIGMELMRAWEMPAAVIRATAEHHFPDYDGEYATYAKLVALSNRLLEHPGMYDSAEFLQTNQLLSQLGISQVDADEALAEVRAQHSEFMSMAHAMAA